LRKKPFRASEYIYFYLEHDSEWSIEGKCPTKWIAPSSTNSSISPAAHANTSWISSRTNALRKSLNSKLSVATALRSNRTWNYGQRSSFQSRKSSIGGKINGWKAWVSKPREKRWIKSKLSFLSLIGVSIKKRIKTLTTQK